MSNRRSFSLDIGVVLFLAVMSLFFVCLFIYSQGHSSLRFSDGAKMADIARNMLEGRGYVSSFGFFPPRFASYSNYFFAGNVPAAMPVSFAISFLMFGVSDSTVLFTSVFYFILLAASVYFLGKKIYARSVGIFAALTVMSHIAFLDYATSGASEILFSAQIVLSFYLLSFKKRTYDLIAFSILVAAYFTRPQAFIVIAIAVLYKLMLQFSLKKAHVMFIGIILIGIFVDRFILVPLSWHIPVYAILWRGIEAIFIYAANPDSSSALRGAMPDMLTIQEILVRSFYNLYNFFKLSPSILSPYILIFFLLSFLIAKTRQTKIFSVTTFYLVFSFFLLAALTLPLYRYLHPIVPVVYVVGIGTLSIMIRGSTIKTISLALVVGVNIVSMLGFTLIDSRSYLEKNNIGKMNTYQQIGRWSQIHTETNSIILTNLDTWVSWYGDRRSIWFPLQVEQACKLYEEIEYDAILLADYRIDDQNYYMNDEWRELLFNPETISATCFADNFSFSERLLIPKEEVFEDREATAVLYKRNQ